MTELIIRADGNNYIGMGHLKRALDIADYLARKHGKQAVLMTQDDPAARYFVALIHPKQKIVWFNPNSYMVEEQAYLNEHQPDTALLDIMVGYTERERMQPYLDHVTRTIVLGGDPDPVPVYAQVLINPNPCNLAEKRL